MGFKVRKDTPAMERELIYLLTDLCVEWGFCIPPEDHLKISKKQHYSAMQFAEDVVKAEGLDGYSNWIKGIAKRFRERFQAEEIDALTFTGG